MKIGVISDTHDHLVKIKQAVEIFNTHKVKLVLHAGDFIAPFSLNPFDDLISDWIGVFGNNDGERQGLIKKSQERIKEAPFFLKLGKKRIALMHEFDSVNADIIVCGHTHNLEIKEEDGRLIINPGEACGWLTAKSSLVILDLENLNSEAIYF
jgi:hypothetical protein